MIVQPEIGAPFMGATAGSRPGLAADMGSLSNGDWRARAQRPRSPDDCRAEGAATAARGQWQLGPARGEATASKENAW